MLIVQLSAVFSHFPHYPQSNWALLVLIPGSVGLCTFQDPVGLSNELSCESGSFSCCCLNPHVFNKTFSIRGLRLYFPVPELQVAQSLLLPNYSSWSMCSRMWDCPVHNLLPRHFYQLLPCPPATVLLAPVLQPPPYHKSSLPQLPISTPPTSLDECFFFNSLVVRIPHSLIFCLFWLVFVFKFVVLLLVVWGGTLCLSMPPPWPEVKNYIKFKLFKCSN